MKATLILANGSVFSGTSIGGTSDRICEMVFNTSMTGYQEILTDPSYAGQGVVMSYPLIGNYGVNHEDNESRRPWVEALVVRHLSPQGSNFRCEDTLDSYLKQYDITGIQGVDTRALTKILRSQGSMNGMLTCAEHFNVAEVMERLRSYEVKDTIRRVTRTEPEVFDAYGEETHLVAVMDYGVKQNIIECLRRRGCKVVALPAYTPASEVLSSGFDGVMLSAPAIPLRTLRSSQSCASSMTAPSPSSACAWATSFWPWPPAPRQAGWPMATGAATTPSVTWRRNVCSSPARTTAIWSSLTRWTLPWPRYPTSTSTTAPARD